MNQEVKKTSKFGPGPLLVERSGQFLSVKEILFIVKIGVGNVITAPWCLVSALFWNCVWEKKVEVLCRQPQNCTHQTTEFTRRPTKFTHRTVDDKFPCTAQRLPDLQTIFSPNCFFSVYILDIYFMFSSCELKSICF